MLTRFVPFDTAHVGALVLSFALPAALVPFARRQQGRSSERFMRHALAAILAVNWVLWLAYLERIGGIDRGNALPMNLCDWATIATVATLVWPNQRTYELAYFWALGGTLQGMLTPDIPYDFPDIQFILFFVYHGGIIASVLYLTFGVGLRPLPVSIPRVIVWSLVYATVAGAVDWLLRVNYGMLRSKPPFPTVLDFMAPWPWYIPELVVLGILSVLVYYAPWFVADVLRSRKLALRSR
jgi:hypothetical integral membrane protein (TIGR02206 family)